MAIARLKWSDYEYGKVTAASGYTITGSDGTEINALSALGLPQINQQHPANPLLLAEQPIIRKLTANGSTWEATVRWSIPASGDQNGTTNDPNLDPIEVEWEPGSESEAVSRDIFGAGIVNSAADAYENQYRNTKIWYVSIFRTETFFDFATADDYRDTLNSNLFILKQPNGRTITIHPGSAKCDRIIPAGRYKTSATAVRMAYRFAIKSYPDGTKTTDKTVRKSPWQRWLPDLGTRSYFQDTSGPPKAASLYDNSDPRMPLTTPVRLNGQGQPIDTQYLVTSKGLPSVPVDLLPAPPNGPEVVFVGTGDRRLCFLVYQDFAGRDFSKLALGTVGPKRS